MAGTSASGGRNAKTRRALDLSGTAREDRHDHVNPEPPLGRPTAPKPLEGDALAEWDRMIIRMETSGTLSVVDDAALYQYCQLFAETEAYAISQSECEASVDVLEANLSGLEGAELVQCFQEISKMRKLAHSYGTDTRSGRMAIRQYLVEFGMTPAARSRVKLPAGKVKSKLDQFKDAFLTKQ